MKRLFTLFVVMLLCVSCGREPVEEINDSEINLFGTKAGNGGLAYACQELDDLCQTMGVGCKAHQMFCASGGVATKIEEMICGKLADACSAGVAMACDIATQHCTKTTTPANPPAPPAPPANPPAPPATPPTPPTPSTPPTPPAPPAMPNMTACCQAIEDCVTNQTGCDQIIAQCASDVMPDLSGMLQPFLNMCNNSLPFLPQLFSAACCQQVNDCVTTQTGCDQAMQTCLGFSMPSIPMPNMPSMPSMPNMPGVPSLTDLFNQVCQP